MKFLVDGRAVNVQSLKGYWFAFWTDEQRQVQSKSLGHDRGFSELCSRYQLLSKERYAHSQTKWIIWEGQKMSLQFNFKQCGKPDCRCQSGERHGPYWMGSWKEGTRVRHKYFGRTLPPGCEIIE